jgi:predicted component of type VI protein secretion system
LSSNECAKVSSFEKTRSDYTSRYKASVNLIDFYNDRKSFNIICSRNILLTERNEIKLADLGLSKVMENTHASTFVGSPSYMSPEVFKTQFIVIEYYPNTDIWYEMIY